MRSAISTSKTKQRIRCLMTKSKGPQKNLPNPFRKMALSHGLSRNACFPTSWRKAWVQQPWMPSTNQTCCGSSLCNCSKTVFVASLISKRRNRTNRMCCVRSGVARAFQFEFYFLELHTWNETFSGILCLSLIVWLVLLDGSKEETTSTSELWGGGGCFSGFAAHSFQYCDGPWAGSIW